MSRSVILYVLFAVLLVSLIGAALSGCDKADSVTSNIPDATLPQEYQLTGEQLLTQSLDDIQALSDWAASASQAQLNSPLPLDKSANVAADSTFVYGQLSPEGYGSVVTVKYGHPKGILLITLKRAHGEAGGGVVTETRKYISYESLRGDIPQDWSRVEVTGASLDTIVTHAERNGVIETYTFRLPVVTRTVNSLDGSVRVSTHYARGGIIFTEITDEHGALIQSRQTSGWADGSTLVRTENPDHSWRAVRTLGRADGTILREITSGN